MGLWDVIGALPVTVDGYTLERRELAARPGWTRVTTTVALAGAGETGRGEDVGYVADDNEGFPDALLLAGTWSLAELSSLLDRQVLFAVDPQMEASRDYRRWAFESAAVDLALRQAGRSLAGVAGRSYAPLRFVVSTRASAEDWLAVAPGLEFKLDVEADWDGPLLGRLAALGRVRVLDFKAYYRGTSVDLAPDPELYRAVAEAFPEAVLEDPWLEDGCRQALAGAEGRLSFDAPVHALADLDALPVSQRWLNVKPSRFGTLPRLLECVEACAERGIRMYGGGQFELGVGRRQIQRLASLFYPDGQNDVAPSVYNEGGPRPGLPASPLPVLDEVGF